MSLFAQKSILTILASFVLLGACHAKAEVADVVPGLGDLERWTAFHGEVEKLPVEEREVVGLIFYHGWSQPEVAELFRCTVRTVQRRWKAAMLKLHAILNPAENGGLKS